MHVTIRNIFGNHYVEDDSGNREESSENVRAKYGEVVWEILKRDDVAYLTIHDNHREHA